MTREKDECPFCGEPIDYGAESCPHCGSDAETGWNPDSDSLSLELPDDEEEEEEEGIEASLPDPAGARAHLARLLGPALVAGSWVVFVAVGSAHWPPGIVLLPGAYLAGCILVLSRLAPKPAVRP